MKNLDDITDAINAIYDAIYDAHETALPLPRMVDGDNRAKYYADSVLHHLNLARQCLEEVAECFDDFDEDEYDEDEYEDEPSEGLIV